MALRAGQEVDAYCTKCKLELLHRIVAVANDKPVKVECRTCYQVHMYRAVKRDNAVGTSTPARSGGASASSDRGSRSGRHPCCSRRRHNACRFGPMC